MARGTSTLSDVVTTTIDGRPLNDVWAESQRVLDIINEARDNLVAHFAFRTIEAGAEIAQTSALDDFEDSSEFGQPKGIRGPGELLALGFNLKTRDLATRFTRMFLMEASLAQVEAVTDRAFEADNRQVYQSVLGAILNPSPRVNSGSSTFDGGDVRDAYKLVAEHGHGDPTMGGRVVVFLNPNEAEAVRGAKSPMICSLDRYAPLEQCSGARSQKVFTIHW